MVTRLSPSDPADVADGLRAHGYLPDDGLAVAVFLALALERPLLLEGEAGSGKTELARVLSRWSGGDLIRLSCYEGIDVAQAVYEWDWSRQLLHLRTVEAGRGPVNPDELYSERFLVRRPLLRALTAAPDAPVPILLVDEVDRSDDEFEALLLEILSDWSVTVPELGEIHAATPPIAVLTSNRTRDLHDALKRRCIYHWVEHPSFEREVEILAMKVPEADVALARDVAAAVAVLRSFDLYKPPGVAESIDWARALVRLGSARLDEAQADVTLGVVLKYHEDQERVRDEGVSALVRTAVAGG